MKTAPTTTLSERDIQVVLAFHGHICPMVLLGARMAREAMVRLPTGGEGSTFAFFRGRGCALDGVQVISGCTWGNGNLVVLRGRDFSLLLAREGQEQGVLVRPRPEILKELRQKGSASVLESEVGRAIVGGGAGQVVEVSERVIPAHLTLYPEESL